MFSPFSVLAAVNGCLIMALQIQQIQLLGRSRRRFNLKPRLKINQRVVWKFGMKLKDKQQSCTRTTNTVAILLFSQQNHSKHGLKVPSPFALRSERLRHQQLTQREGERRAPPSGRLLHLSQDGISCHGQTGKGVTKISVIMSSLNPIHSKSKWVMLSVRISAYFSIHMEVSPSPD